MTIETVLTEKEVIAMKHSLGVIAPDEFFNKIARAIEKAVLQSPEVAAWKKDSERLAYAYTKTPTESDALVDIEMRLLNDDSPTINEVRTAIDAAMEKQP